VGRAKFWVSAAVFICGLAERNSAQTWDFALEMIASIIVEPFLALRNVKEGFQTFLWARWAFDRRAAGHIK